MGLKSSVASTSIDGGDGDGGGSGVVRTGDGKDKGKGQGQEEGEDREAIGRPDEVVRLGKGVLVEGKASVEGVVGDWSIVGVGATVQRGAKVEEVGLHSLFPVHLNHCRSRTDDPTCPLISYCPWNWVYQISLFLLQTKTTQPRCTVARPAPQAPHVPEAPLQNLISP